MSKNAIVSAPPGAPPSAERGFTLVELLFAVSIAATLTAIAIPLTSDAIDALRTLNAVRYVEGRIIDARMEAVKRSTAVALRFELFEGEYLYRTYVDGNGNGVRTADIQRGTDRALTALERLGDNFPGVRFALIPAVPDLDGSASGDAVRVGASHILTMAPNGTSSSGTLYIRGRSGQFAVRVLGATGRTRVLRYDTGAGRWIAR